MSGPTRGGTVGADLLASRLRATPGELRRAFATLPAEVERSGLGRGGIRSVVATGAGSSAAHARLLASVLAERGLRARALPLTAFLGGRSPAAGPDEAVIVFSQGLSPNARVALGRRADGGRTWLVTATGSAGGEATGAGAPIPASPRDAAAGDPARDPASPPALAAPVPRDAAATTSSSSSERRATLRELLAQGVSVVRTPGADEFGTLLRVVGPMVGFAAALAIADALAPSRTGDGATPPIEPGLVSAACAAVEEAPARLLRDAAGLSPRELASPISFLASGAHVERIANLPLKILEGLLRPLPGAIDLLDFAHGPFQQAWDGPSLLLACSRDDAPGERELVARLAAMLDPSRHRLVELRSSLPGAWAVFEHEALANAFVHGEVERLGLDPGTWPGQGRDAPLYGFDGAASGEEGRGTASAGAHPSAPRLDAANPPDAAASTTPILEALAWTDVARRIARGGATALLPLGSTEQHGPHLPIGTDTVIAAELARRLAERIPEAIVLPALALGCAGEHMGFPGTLDLREDTLAAILRDVAVSLERHGVGRLFVFSAHGGNRQALDRAIPALREALPRLRVGRGPGAEAMGPSLAASRLRHGVSVEASGRHAGELETSILLRLAPALVRTDRSRPGLLLGEDDPDPFYPDLREKASDGTVGDPRPAAAARAESYLAAWVDALLEAYRNPASWNQTKGSQNA